MEDKNQESKAINSSLNQSTSSTSNFIGYSQVHGTTGTMPTYTGTNWDGSWNVTTNSIPQPLFIIGQTIYHITPESGKGYIIDIRYNYKDNTHEYLVTWGPTVDGWYFDTELSLELQF